MIQRIFFLIVVLHCTMYAQNESLAPKEVGFEDTKDVGGFTFDINNFYGTILKHNPDVSHLITGHPSGVILSFSRKTFGNKEWERLHDYPDYGVSFVYQDMDNESLGEHFGLFAHYNFYFLRRNLMFRIAQGISYNTNPYDEDENFRNIAYGTHLLSSTYALFNYKRENIIGGIGLQAGLGVVHYSNANFRAPNTSTNTFIANVGVHYVFDQDPPEYIKKEEGILRGAEPFGFGFILRTGIHESDVVGSGQFTFIVPGIYIDKRLNKKSALYLGTELFFSEALERFIDYRASGGFDDGVTGDEDSKRLGVFLGHELRLANFSIVTDVGYYVYYPFDFEGRLYNRIGGRYYFTENIFASTTVKSHVAKAEAVEFTVGYRF